MTFFKNEDPSSMNNLIRCDTELPQQMAQEYDCERKEQSSDQNLIVEQKKYETI